MGFLLLALAVCALALGAPAAAQQPGLTAWACDPLEKVFPDATPQTDPGVIRLAAARAQTASGQLAVAVDGGTRRVTLSADPLTGPGGHLLAADRVHWHFQGFIPLAHNTADTPDSELLRKAPCEVPDVLLAERELEVVPGRVQPVWIAVDVPETCPPGDYRGRVCVRAGTPEAEVPLELHVYDFALPRERHLWVTNWFSVERIASAHRLELWSEPFWEMLGRYARMVAAHRQNVVLTPVSLVQVRRTAGGRLRFDFSRFDRYVRLFEEAGAAGRIELGHVASFGEGGWSSKEIVLQPVRATDAATGASVSLGPEEGLGPLLRALQAHLRQRGWLSRAMIHVADEPAVHNRASWRRASEFVHRYAPGIRRIDAIEGVGWDGALEVWVPKLSHLNAWYESFREAQRKGAEMWFYTCCHPMGFYPNRFLDFALMKTRVLHWLNALYDLDGYLHWGLNFWGDNPFGAPGTHLPPGDTHIVYPGADGPLSSLRWEAMREGIEDCEWLHLLAERTAKVAARLGKAADGVDPKEAARGYARLVTPSFAQWEHSPERFRAVRDRLAREIEEVEKPPLVLLKTNPRAGSEVVPGPIVVGVSGVVEPGASVKVEGAAVDVEPDGRFETSAGLWAGHDTITVEVARAGQAKRVVRQFRVRQ